MSRLRIERYRECDAEAWDAFLAVSLNGTIFHRRRFLSYHPPDRFRDHSLLFYRGQRLIGVFPAALIDGDGGTVLKSHPGASYGGVVVGEPPGTARAHRMVEAIVDEARRLGCAALELRTAPRIFDRGPCDELEFALGRNGFQVRALELSTCYSLARLDGAAASTERILASFQSSCARAARKAIALGLKPVWCEQREQFDSYWELLAQTLRSHRAAPTHSKDELYRLKQLFPEDVQLLAVEHEGRMIGGLVAFVCNERAAHVFYFASDPDEQHRRPLNLAVLELVRFAATRRLRFVNFGVSTEDGGRVVNWGLFRFKEGFGGGGTLRRYWVRRLGGDDG